MARPQGRPEIGPKVETRLSEEIVAIIDGDANKRFIKRAEWLRRAAIRSLPHQALGRQDLLDDGLAEADGWLRSAREAALDGELPQQEREFQGAAYAACVSQMRDVFRQALDSIPVREANQAYAQAQAADSEETPELAELWGRATGASMAAAILDALLLTLPIDSVGVKERAKLDDPMMDLGE
jgi:hypothetical protein